MYPQYQGPEALQGIRCSDTALRTDNVTELQPILSEFLETSSVLGDVEPNSIFLACAAWKMQAKERLQWPMEEHTNQESHLVCRQVRTILLRPLPSARNTSAAFEGSVVLEHLGYGVSFTLLAL